MFSEDDIFLVYSTNVQYAMCHVYVSWTVLWNLKAKEEFIYRAFFLLSCLLITHSKNTINYQNTTQYYKGMKTSLFISITLNLWSFAHAFVYPTSARTRGAPDGGFLKKCCTTRTSSSSRTTTTKFQALQEQQPQVSSSADNDDLLFNNLKSMKVKDIKQELELAGIDTKDIFEKNDLITRLVKHRKKKQQQEQKNKEQHEHDQPHLREDDQKSPTTRGSIRIPMEFHSLTPTESVASKTSNVYLRPSPGKYPSIQLTVPRQSRKLTLLVDTACSGIVVRPSILNLYNLPKINTGVSMTAAGGTTTAESVVKLASPRMEDGTVLEDMIVAGQDIGALPSVLDGIIGLSFLNQFQSVTFDFEHSELVLSKTAVKEKMPWTGMEVVAKSSMKLCRIGVWTVDVTLDGRGPVNMLVDTGAAATFLNWKGVKDLKMDRNHPRIEKNRNALGVMGADNVALALSHRFVLKSRVNLTSDPTVLGPFEPLGLEIQKHGSLNVDIGDLPVLSILQGDNVGGIMGNDILMRCDVLHFDLSRSGSPEMFLLNRSVA
jgi:hypothetical protein